MFEESTKALLKMCNHKIINKNEKLLDHPTLFKRSRLERISAELRELSQFVGNLKKLRTTSAPCSSLDRPIWEVAEEVPEEIQRV